MKILHDSSHVVFSNKQNEDNLRVYLSPQVFEYGTLFCNKSTGRGKVERIKFLQPYNRRCATDQTSIAYQHKIPSGQEISITDLLTDNYGVVKREIHSRSHVRQPNVSSFES